MSKPITWTPESEKTFAAIITYLEKEWNNHVLLTFLDKVEHVLSLISENPELFLLVNKEKQVHKCVIVKQVSLFYKIKSEQIDLITFWDTRQDPKKLKE